MTDMTFWTFYRYKSDGTPGWIAYFRILGYGLWFEYGHHVPCFSERMGLKKCLHVGKLAIQVLRP